MERRAENAESECACRTDHGHESRSARMVIRRLRHELLPGGGGCAFLDSPDQPARASDSSFRNSVIPKIARRRQPKASRGYFTLWSNLGGRTRCPSAEGGAPDRDARRNLRQEFRARADLR